MILRVVFKKANNAGLGLDDPFSERISGAGFMQHQRLLAKLGGTSFRPK
jgi:hypothetical protein